MVYSFTCGFVVIYNYLWINKRGEKNFVDNNIKKAFHLFNPGNSANIFVLMGYEKLLISFVKYIP